MDTLKQVLVVESDPDVRGALILILSKEFECVGMATRDDAMSSLKAGFRPACVVMAYTLPGMSFDDFIKGSKSFVSDIILLTVPGDAPKITNLHGVSMTLEKPVPPDVIVRIVKRALGLD